MMPIPVADKYARPVYKYFFTYAIENPDSVTSGAFHGLELSFVFGTIPLGVSWFSGPFGPTQAEIDLTHAIEGYWARFAATGDPHPTEAGSLRSLAMARGSFRYRTRSV